MKNLFGLINSHKNVLHLFLFVWFPFVLSAQQQFSIKSLTSVDKFGDEFRAVFHVKEISEFNPDSTENAVCIENGLRSSTYLNIDDWLSIKDEVKVTGIAVVFSKYPVINGVYPKFHQLLCNRLKNLFEIDPALNKKDISWEMILQTNCINDSQVATLFHGIVIKYEEFEQPKNSEKLFTIDSLYNKPFSANTSNIEQLAREGKTSTLFPDSFISTLKDKPYTAQLDSMIGYLETNLKADSVVNIDTQHQKELTDKEKQILFVIKRYEVFKQDNTVIKVLNRNNWKNSLVVADWTGSMYSYGSQVLAWYIYNQQSDKIKYITLFNDGDNKPNNQKKIGETGGIYHSTVNNIVRIAQLYYLVSIKGTGGDGPENDMEALLAGMRQYPDYDDLILIADNYACVRDIQLLDSIKKPIHVIACGYHPMVGINPQLVEIAQKTNGSLHTLDLDMDDMSDIKVKNKKIKFQSNEIPVSTLPCFEMVSDVVVIVNNINKTIYTNLDSIKKAGLQGHQLDLSNQSLTKIPKPLLKLEAIRTLNLNQNNLTELPDKMKNLTTLISLSACCNQLSRVSPEVVEITMLTKLDLSNNNIDTLPANLFNLTFLTSLNLNNNHISYLPPRLGCRKLEYLFIKNNNLKKLPVSIGALRKLKVLVLADNELSELPKNMGMLAKLEVLDLSNNQLTKLPNSIGKLSNLKAIKLVGNPISQEELFRIKTLLPSTIIEL